MDKLIMKERFEYIIGFLALVISLNGFKDELKAVKVNVVLFQFTLANYFFILILSLIAVLHFYFIPFFIRNKNGILKYLEKGCIYVVNYSLFFIVVSPLVLLLMAGIAKLTPIILNKGIVSVVQVLVMLSVVFFGKYVFRFGEFIGSGYARQFNNMTPEQRERFEKYMKDLEEEERRVKGVFCVKYLSIVTKRAIDSYRIQREELKEKFAMRLALICYWLLVMIRAEACDRNEYFLI